MLLDFVGDSSSFDQAGAILIRLRGQDGLQREYGFRLLEQFELPFGGPVIWTMWRDLGGLRAHA